MLRISKSVNRRGEGVNLIKQFYMKFLANKYCFLKRILEPSRFNLIASNAPLLEYFFMKNSLRLDLPEGARNRKRLVLGVL